MAAKIWITPPAMFLITSAAALCMSVLTGCSDTGTPADTGVVRVDIIDDAGEQHTFFVEPALDNETRVLGLSHRTEIAPDGGMIFVFRTPRVQNFVMRHCPIPIDIVYLDAEARVVAQHAMVPEEPQREGESDADYEGRLPKYSSRFSVPIVLEFAAGTNERLGIDEGDVIKVYGLNDLRKRAR
ncbi:MAG: DUF192 domain-containing protein [Planctomycetota bacterium]